MSKVIKTITWTAVVCLLGLVIIIILKKLFIRGYTTNNSKNTIKVLEKRDISQHTSLYHIQIGQKHIFLGESKIELRQIAEINPIKEDGE